MSSVMTKPKAVCLVIIDGHFALPSIAHTLTSIYRFILHRYLLMDLTLNQFHVVFGVFRPMLSLQNIEYKVTPLIDQQPISQRMLLLTEEVTLGQYCYWPVQLSVCLVLIEVNSLTVTSD